MRGIRRRIRSFAIIGVFSLVAASCGTSKAAVATSSSSSPNQTIHIGVILSLTGPVAFAGVEEQDAIKLAISQINASHLIGPGRTLSAEYLDDMSTQPQAGALIRQLVAQPNIVAELGPTISGTAEVVGPVAQKAGLTMFSVSANSGAIVTKPGKYVFTAPITAQQDGQALANLMVNHYHYKRVFAVYARDFAGEVVNAQSVISPLKKLGASVDVSTVLTANTDYAPVITQLRSYHPDAIYMGLNGPQAGSFMQQAKSLGVSIPAFGMPPTETPQLISNGGTSVEGMIFPADYNPALNTALNHQFVSAYTAKYGSAPSDYAALAFSSTYVLAKAISTIKGTITRTSVQQALSASRTYNNVVVGTGKFKFTSQRIGSYTPVFITVKNGKFVGYTG